MNTQRFITIIMAGNIHTEPIGNNFYPGMNATKNVAKLWHGKIVSMWTLNNEHNEMTSIIVKLKLDSQVINEELGYGFSTFF